VKIEPQYQTGRIGESVFFSCESITYTNWKFEGGALPENVLIVVNRILVKHITKENAGYYSCEGVSVRNTSFESEGLLKVISKY